MRHLGDITKINGKDAPVVDCIIGGSPCQDLSLAGKRAGLAGARSGLYMEQIRIIKEMREADAARGNTDVDIRPRYMVWENVPGAFSTNQGKDFAAVIEEAIRVAEPEAPDVPVPEKGWPTSGCLLGDKWSIAWRVLDAQFWGTSDKPLPQRRRRIALVADFGGLSAPEILFVRKSVSGNLEPGEPKRKETARDVGEGSRGTDNGVKCLTPWDTQTRRVYDAQFKYPSLCSGENSGQNQQSVLIKKQTADTAVPYTLKIRGGCDGGKVQTLTSRMGTGGGNVPMVMEPVIEPGIASRKGGHVYEGVCGTLRAKAGDNQMSVAYQSAIGKEVNCYRQGGFADYVEGEVGTLRASGGDYGGGTENLLVELNVRYIVRRLTPLECERLQGFPDGWTDIPEWADSKGKRHKMSDSARYKALGNSIALPPWKWVLKRLCACYERDATMASLFDGIGGFPYIWEQLNGEGSCLWASEIEEFPIAVTKLRFGHDNIQNQG